MLVRAQSSASGEPFTLPQRRDEFSVFAILKLQCEMSYLVSLTYANCYEEGIFIPGAPVAGCSLFSGILAVVLH